MERLCGRPKGYEDKILRNISNVVQEGDVLYHLGDFAWVQDRFWANIYTSTSPATNVLIRGNHDRRSIGWWLDHGFDVVADMLTLNAYGWKIYLTHRPVNILGEMKSLVIHGHVHNTAHHKAAGYGHSIAFFIEHHYSPVSLAKIVDDYERGLRESAKIS